MNFKLLLQDNKLKLKLDNYKSISEKLKAYFRPKKPEELSRMIYTYIIIGAISTLETYNIYFY